MRIARIATITLAAGGIASAAACTTATQRQAAAANANGQECFLPRQVNGFNALDEDTVHVSVGANRVYELQLFGICPNVDWSHQIGIRSTAGGSWVCRGHEAELLVPGPTGVDECLVTAVRSMTEAQAEALREARD